MTEAGQDLIQAALKRLLERRETLSRAEARELLGQVLDLHLGLQRDLTPCGEAFEAESQTAGLRTAALLGALAARGETTEELAGFVECLRARATSIPLAAAERARLVDTCGTGGDGSGTFNISTAAGLVAAAAGAWVAKHGNRAVTSRSGSADVLEALGVPVDLTPEEAAGALRRFGFAFLSAPALQPGMRGLMPIRRAVGVRTAFNILGPMTNPAGAATQVLGVYAAELVPVVAKTLAALGTRHALVVHGGGMDEFALHAPTEVGEVRDGEVRFSRVTAADFGLQVAPIKALAGGSAESNAIILRKIFAGERGPARDVVVMNAAAVLVVTARAKDFHEGAALAADIIASGRVRRLVEALSGQG